MKVQRKLPTQYSFLFFGTLQLKILLFFLDGVWHVLNHGQLSLLFRRQMTDAFFILLLPHILSLNNNSAALKA